MAEKMAGKALKITLLGRWQQIYEALVLYYIDKKQPQAAFRWAERARARAFAEALLKASPSEMAEMTDTEFQSASVEEVQSALPAGAFCQR